MSQRSAAITVSESPTDDLYGREREVAALVDLVQNAHERGAVSLLRGQAGIGKSSLLGAVSARARGLGLTVRSTAGVQSEARLPFAGLHQLVWPMLDLAGRLPGRQRDALLSAFGVSSEAAPAPFMVALATLELISEATADDPVLLTVDDAQWLDDASSAALAFVARRLDAEAVVMLVAIREGYDSPFDAAGLPELTVQPLDQTASRALLDARMSRLQPLTRKRVLEEAQGNPLALVELSRAWRSESVRLGSPLVSSLPLTARLQRAFAFRGSELPALTRSLLLVAAANDRGTLSEVLNASAILEEASVTLDDLTPAVAARLVEIHDGRLSFRHPLIRSAIYHEATFSQRQAVHAALSEVLAAEPDRRVWHRAATTLGPDEEIADELGEAADRARRLGAVRVAIVAYQRAVELSGDPARRGTRLLRAAELAFELGRPELGARLLQAAERLELAPDDRTRLSWLKERSDDRWHGVSDVGSLVKTGARIRTEGHDDLAMKLLLTGAMRCWWGNPDEDSRADVVDAAESTGVAADDPGLLAVLAHADPIRRGANVIEQISRMRPDLANPAAMFLVGSAACAVWAYDRALPFLDVAVDGLRTQGRLGLLAEVLVAQAWAAVHLAREPLAVSASEEATRLASETGQARWAVCARLAQGAIAAERGDFDAAEAVAREAEAVLLPMGATPMIALVRFVRGRGAVAHQHYPEGLELLRRTLDPADPAYHPYIGAWGLSDLVEAASHTGKRDEARAYLERLESLAAATSGSLLTAAAGYARPMVADDDDAEALYQTALRSDLANWPCYRGRMLLWYGRWLRRQRRVADSRAPLRAAREVFDALAFPKLAEAAREELRASGVSSPRRKLEAWDRLTPQELQVARMATQGLSNREIGQKLYLSHKTIGFHLHRVFAKLGITSRTQLHTALGAAAGDLS